jgi:hypothetical protein
MLGGLRKYWWKAIGFLLAILGIIIVSSIIWPNPYYVDIRDREHALISGLDVDGQKIILQGARTRRHILTTEVLVG